MAKQHLKKQKNSFRQRNRLVIFAAEGHNKTETYYLQDFVKDTGKIKLHRSHDASTDPVGMVNGLISTIRELDFSPSEGDLAFCILDMDRNKDKEEQLKKAISLAEKHDIQIIVSNPCFELWFICHFTKTPRNYASSKELLKDMQNYIKDYGKSMDGIYQLTREHLDEAIINAENLERRALNAGYKKYTAAFSPTTEMYILVSKIKEGSKS